MNSRLEIKSFKYAAIFLVAYLNVFITQAACNLSHLFEQTEIAHHNDHDGNEEVPPHHHDDKSDHQHNEKSEKKGSCCNDKTSDFFANQSTHSTSSVNFKNTHIVVAFINTAFFICNQTVYNSKGHISYSLPPPKIPDIRVFVNSFII